MKNISKDCVMDIVNETISNGCQVLPVNEDITRIYGKDVKITVRRYEVIIEKLNEEKMYSFDVNNGFYKVWLLNR